MRFPLYLATSNCTNMELKLSIFAAPLLHLRPSNCTNMELKLWTLWTLWTGVPASNCTNMELKQSKGFLPAGEVSDF